MDLMPRGPRLRATVLVTGLVIASLVGAAVAPALGSTASDRARADRGGASAAGTDRSGLAVKGFGTLAGRVLDPDGAGLATDLLVYRQVRDELVSVRDSDNRPAVYRADPDGRFRISLPAGDYRLGSTTADGYGPVVFVGGATTAEGSRSLRVRSGRQTAASVSLLTPGAISGRVVDVQGVPVSGAEVRLVRNGVRRGARQALTDADGRYVVSDVPPGSYLLVTSADGFLSEKYPDTPDRPEDRGELIAVTPGAELTSYDVTLARGSEVEIHFSDPQGRPVQGGVSLRRLTETGWVEAALVYLDADGRATARDLPAATYRLAYRDVLPNGDLVAIGAKRADGSPTPDTPAVTVGDDQTVVVDRLLDSRRRLLGTVTGVGSHSSTVVTVQRSEGGRWVGVTRVRVDAEDRFTTPMLPVGTYRLDVRSDYRFVAVTRPSAVVATRSTRFDTVLLGRVVRGRVEAPTGRRTVVEAVRKDGTVAASVAVAGAGDFVLGPLRDGDYAVRYRDRSRRTADFYDSRGAHGAAGFAGANFYDLDQDIDLAPQAAPAGRVLHGRVLASGGTSAPPAVVEVRRRTSRGWVEVGYSRVWGGYWRVPGLQSGVDYRLRYAWYYDSGTQAELARVEGGCTLAAARSFVIGRDALQRNVGTTRTARWPAYDLKVVQEPVVRGTARVGGRLTVTSGRWAPCGVSLTYQWRRDGRSLAGARGTSYRPTSADVGHRLTVLVVARTAGTDGVARFSPRTPARAVTDPTAVVRR